jgi:hypothetical protein
VAEREHVPTCGYRPTDSRELEPHRDGLATIWLIADPDHPGRVIGGRHCERCRPHRARIVMCGLFDTTVMLGDDLAVPKPSPLSSGRAVAHHERWETARRLLVLRQAHQGQAVSEPLPRRAQSGRRASRYSSQARRIVAQSPKLALLGYSGRSLSAAGARSAAQRPSSRLGGQKP